MNNHVYHSCETGNSEPKSIIRLRGKLTELSSLTHSYGALSSEQLHIPIQPWGSQRQRA
jgi:hypothetical protein